jgi:hypothetical protein
MAGSETRLRLLDGALPAAGVVLLVVGSAGVPVATSLAWTALGLAFVGWVAEADGLPWLRPGRIRICSYGCWETPLAFGVCHEASELLFSREEDEHGAWSSEYAVRERPRLGDADPRYALDAGASGSWTLRGRTPVSELRFEHHERVSYVTRRSLERALRTAGFRR